MRGRPQPREFQDAQTDEGASGSGAGGHGLTVLQTILLYRSQYH
jgi:hypothetical protein